DRGGHLCLLLRLERVPLRGAAAPGREHDHLAGGHGELPDLRRRAVESLDGAVGDLFHPASDLLLHLPPLPHPRARFRGGAGDLAGGVAADSPQALRRSASQSRAGVMGTRVISVPRSASASSTAFAMAAGGEMMPLSPTPLMPSSFRMEGKDIAMVSRGGRSAARGMA